MKLSTRARYALRAMVEITRRSDSTRPVSLEKVANATHISRRHPEQLAMALKGASLIRSVSGRRGGYFLSRPADEIRIAQVVEAAIGPINVVECVDLPETCPRSDACACRVIYLMINKRIKEVLDEFSLADLADEAWLEQASQTFGLDLHSRHAARAKADDVSEGRPAS